MCIAESTPEAVQQEIADLERPLQEKCAELATTEPTASYERGEVHAAVGEPVTRMGVWYPDNSV